MRPRRSPSAHLRSCSWIPSWRRSRRARSWYHWQTSSMFRNIPSINKASQEIRVFPAFFRRFPIVFVTVCCCPLDPKNSLAQAVQCFQTSCMEPWKSWLEIRWFVGISAVILTKMAQHWHKSHRLGLALSSGPAIKHCFYTTSAVLPLAFVVRYKSCPIGGQPSRKPWLAMTSWVTNL